MGSIGLWPGRRRSIIVSETIAVIGAGYVGLPLAILLARSGYRVIAVDINPKSVECINQGTLPFPEAGLEQILNESQVRERLVAQTSPSPADVFIVAVGTPWDSHKEKADLSQVIKAVKSITPLLTKGNLIIVESTVPPRTCRDVVTPLIEEAGFKVGEDILLCYCPERMLPGNAIHELVYNDRLMGGVNTKSQAMAQRVYSSFVKGMIHATDDVTAEVVKLMENTYRDVNIALANEFAAVLENLGANVSEAIRLANNHPRVNILKPGIGVGGHCISVDPWFLWQADPQNSELIKCARLVNDSVPKRIVQKIERVLPHQNAEQRIVALGVSYKPDVSDTRNSPALEVVSLLKQRGYHIQAYDPLVSSYLWGTITRLAEGADCLAVLVEHTVIKDELLYAEADIKAVMKNPLILRFSE